MTTTDFENNLLSMRPKLIRIATDFFHNREDAEDVVQEVYIRLLQRGSREDDNLEALAIKATKNLCVSVWRRQRLRNSESLDNVPERMGSELADTSIIYKEKERQIEQAISQLPPSEQKLIRLRTDEDLQSDDIARKTGIPIRSVSTIISSAKRKLRILLTNKDNDR